MTDPAPPLWTPSAERVERAAMTRYMRWLSDRRDLSFADYHELWDWSTTEIEAFWQSIWEFFAVATPTPYVDVLVDRAMPGQWFHGATLNYAEHAFRGKTAEQIAIVHASELRPVTELTWRELRSMTAAVAGGLHELGVGEGDRVAAYMPNIPETVAAFLACASLGAVWSCASPEFGASTVIDRFSQVQPKVLLAVNGYRYNGRDFERVDVLADFQQNIAGLERMVVLPYLQSGPDLGSLADPMSWSELLEAGADRDLEFAAVAFDHPLWVLYSSGTTGPPKAIVHGHGGMLIEHLKKMNLHLDAQQSDRVFWFTTTGWMMWNFLVGVLLTPAAIVLYDGSPAYPDMDVLWDLAERARITCFGTSAAYIASCMKADIEPQRQHDLGRLRSVGSTGSPLSPEGFQWVYDHVGSDTWLFSTSGGTDLCTAFVGGVPLLPVYEGELQARSLGAKVEAFNEQGVSVTDEVGELVITEPMPSMPLFLWGDEDGQRYHESYFDMFADIWRHGDWIEITSRGTAIIHGRSDSTINRGGIRMGTAEIYRAVEKLPEIKDALVVDVARQGRDGWMPLFVVLDDDRELDDDLKRQIAARIREDCSPRHVPDEVYAIDEVPRTLSGKALEVPVKEILMGSDPAQVAARDSLANPNTLDYFIELAAEL